MSERMSAGRNLVIDLGHWRIRFGRKGWRDLGEHEGWTKWYYVFGKRVAVHRGDAKFWGPWWLR